jgi:hypothetical protein
MWHGYNDGLILTELEFISHDVFSVLFDFVGM